ncbi:hypothetical protein QBC45DRAFT_332750 [Copromyces sp. CBS 386.78]|nr:hypothetical protein QBC45DRAFT_332750 [Copromyces sp. CBS 386.78]
MSESQTRERNPSGERRPLSAPASAPGSPRATAAEMHDYREAIRREAQAFGMGLQPADLESPDRLGLLKLLEPDIQHQVQTLATRESAIPKPIDIGKNNTIESTTTEVTTAKSSPTVRESRVRFSDVAGPPPPIVPNYPSIDDITSSCPRASERASSSRQNASAPLPRLVSPVQSASPSPHNAPPLRRRASSPRSRTRASTRSVPTSTKRLPSPLAMIPSPLISDSLSAVIKIAQKFREVAQALGFRDDDVFKVWCKRCVEYSFDNFLEPYMEKWWNYSNRLTEAEVDEATKIGCRALIALLKGDETRFLEGHLSRLQLFARFAIDVVHDDNETHADIPEDNNFLCEHPLGNTQKIRGLIMLADFLLDCRFMEVSTRREYFAASARASERRKIDENVIEDEDDQTETDKSKSVISPRQHMASVLKERAQVPSMDTYAGEKRK